MSAETQPRLKAERLSSPDDWQQVSDTLYRLGQTDGLPIVPPTEERVARFVAASGRDALDVVAVLPPRSGSATVELIAANAVMAGCEPEHMRALIATVECLAQPELNLIGMLTTTHPSFPLLMFNGPIVEELDIDTGGFPHVARWRSTVAIGRAVTLICMNVAGIDGATFNDTHGGLVRSNVCFGEAQDRSPWAPLSVDRGHAADVSTVTVIPAAPGQHIDDKGSTSARSVLATIADSMATVGNRNTHGPGEPWLILGPQHAATVARDGWSKADAQRYLYETARVPLSRFPGEVVHASFETRWRTLFDGPIADLAIPMADRPEDIVIVVSGGAGSHSLFIQTQMGCRSVTRPVV